MICNREVKAAFTLLSSCVVAAGLFVGFVSRADAGGACPFIEEAGVPPGSCTWYVQSGAPSSVDGGYLFPFNNLARAGVNPGGPIIIVAVPTSRPSTRQMLQAETRPAPRVWPHARTSPSPYSRCLTFRSSQPSKCLTPFQ
jgi:hypothetical protein